MGSIDAQGVYQYDNTDQMIPFATYSNLLAGSVSDAIADVRTDLTVADTGWINTGIVWNASWESFGATSGASGYVRYRKIGDVLYMRGLARILITSSGASAGTLTMFTMPSGARVAHPMVTNAYLSLESAGSGVTSSGASAGTAHTHSERVGPMCRVNVNTNGDVQMIRNVGHVMNSGDWVALGGIIYPTN